MSQSDEEIAVLRFVLQRIKRHLRKLRKKPSAVQVLTVMVLLLTAAVAYPYVIRHRAIDPPESLPTQPPLTQPSPARSSSTPVPIAQPHPPEPATGIDITRYCKGLLGFPDGGFDFAQRPASGYCGMRLTQADYLRLCGADTVDFHFKTPTEVTSGRCFDKDGLEVGGVDVSGYCEGNLSKWPGAAPARAKDGEQAWWECRVPISPSLICAAQWGSPGVTAKVDNEMIRCVPEDT